MIGDTTSSDALPRFERIFMWGMCALFTAFHLGCVTHTVEPQARTPAASGEDVDIALTAVGSCTTLPCSSIPMAPNAQPAQGPVSTVVEWEGWQLDLPGVQLHLGHPTPPAAEPMEDIDFARQPSTSASDAARPVPQFFQASW